MSDTETRKGLVGVVADETAISKVNPETNSLLYRGYPVQELATLPFEATAYLLWHGELPTEQQLAQLRSQERAHRALSPELRAVLDAQPPDSHPMDDMRTAVSFLGACDTNGSGSVLDVAGTVEDNLRRSVELFAALPAVVAYSQRRRRGLDVIEPRDDLDYAANLLWMTFGEECAPIVIEAMNSSMVLYAEHSFNASTFTARVITSTLSDLYSAVTGAVGALKGPLHGGANEAVMHTLEEIGSAGEVEAWLDDAIANKRKIMGFGHRVYKSGDSRVPTMQKALDGLFAHYGSRELESKYTALCDAFVERKGIYPNLDYPSGPAYHLIGFDTATFTPLFVAARIAGWTAHIMEQAASNALVRPLAAYNGEPERHISNVIGVQ